MRRKRGGREGRGQRSGAGVAAMGEGWDDSGGSLHLGCEVVVDGGFWCGLMRRMGGGLFGRFCCGDGGGSRWVWRW